MTTTVRKVTLNGCKGVEMPLIGLGMFTVTGSSLVHSVVEAALRSGYRSIDTAAVYRNEEDIGRALKQLLPKLGLRREDIFLTSKLAPGDLGTGHVRPALKATLSRLGTSYLDLYLVHWPGSSRSESGDKLRAETWIELQQLQKEGLVRAIGVSNYTERHLDKLPGPPPSVNQVELHPHYPQRSLLAYCRARGIHVQAYSSLGGHSSYKLTSDPVVREVAKQRGRSAQQVLLRWAVQQDIGVIPKSTKADHIATNLNLDFELSDANMQALNSLSSHQKYAWDPSNVD